MYCWHLKLNKLDTGPWYVFLFKLGNDEFIHFHKIHTTIRNFYIKLINYFITQFIRYIHIYIQTFSLRTKANIHNKVLNKYNIQSDYYDREEEYEETRENQNSKNNDIKESYGGGCWFLGEFVRMTGRWRIVSLQEFLSSSILKSKYL